MPLKGGRKTERQGAAAGSDGVTFARTKPAVQRLAAHVKTAEPYWFAPAELVVYGRELPPEVS